MVRLLRFIAILLFIVTYLQSAGVSAATITVFAAASLKETLEAAGKLFTEKTQHDLRFSFASSSALAKQIENGAPADLFASADVAWMDYLDRKALIDAQSRVNLLGNKLVIVVPNHSALNALEFTRDAFESALSKSRLATGDVNSVPVGIYAKSAFQNLGLWPVVEPKLAQTENVRAALAFVSRGEVELGAVYRTDALIDPSVKIIAEFPQSSHLPIEYPFAMVRTSTSLAAKDFLKFLGSPEAREIFEKAGFQLLK